MLKKLAIIILLGYLFNPNICAADIESKELAKRGVLYLDQGQIDKGIETLEQAIKADSNDYMAFCALGGAYGDFKKDYNKSMEFFQKSIAINENYDMAHFGLAMTYAEQGMKEEAKAEFEKVIAVSSRESLISISREALQRLDR